MKYILKQISIKKLYSLIKDGLIDLRPSYQRNFIWGKKDQQSLIDSILKGWPLPTFFIYKKPDGKFEMVDGQQRAETICRYIKGITTDSTKRTIHEIDQDAFEDYLLNIIEISDLDVEEDGDIAAFYALVNKQGNHLNESEINKAQYASTTAMKIVEELLNSEEMSQLDLFNARTQNRMNDRALVEELVAYLKSGFYDKREAVINMFEEDIPAEVLIRLSRTYITVIQRILLLNSRFPINETRYRQRGDFFTLFTYISSHMDLSDDILLYQYKLLVWLDKENEIRPTNEDCELFYKYAMNCVMQSNSKPAREKRLQILNQILCHTKDTIDYEYNQMITYLQKKYPGITQKEIGEYYLINIDK